MSTMNQFCTHDRLQSSPSCHDEKPDRAVQSVRIGEGEGVLTLFSYSLAPTAEAPLDEHIEL